MSAIRSTMRWVMAAFYVFAGIGHFLITDKLLLIVPDWVPFPREVLYITGGFEVVCAVALLTPRFRRIAGILFAVYAVCVWPANIKHAIEGIHVPPLPDSWWYHGPRLVFQPVLIWLALFCSGVTDWPFARRPGKDSHARP